MQQQLSTTKLVGVFPPIDIRNVLYKSMHVYQIVLCIHPITVSFFMNACHIQKPHFNVNYYLNVDGV